MSERSLQHKESFITPILKQNPLFVSILGTCPALAVTKSLEASFGMGLLFTFVVCCSNVLISALRKLIPEEVRTPCYIVIIAAFVTITRMLTEAFLPELYSSLGVFLALLVVNCIVLGRAEAFASKNSVFDSLLDGLGNGVGYTWAICLIGVIREILGTGMITFGKIFTFIPLFRIPILKALDGSFNYSMSVFSLPTGGFIVFGLILAVIAAIEGRKKAKEKIKLQAEMKAAVKGEK
ncbi:MAG: electron transport complex subunit RsxE [Bacilli bacterium]|jgi:electron transport complex protein RnfE|nr:electron transport complex subunit RsxE [Bacilli bacterium]